MLASLLAAGIPWREDATNVLPIAARNRIRAWLAAGGEAGVGHLIGLTKDEIDVPMDFDALKGVGSMLGTACITVIAEGTDMIQLMGRVTQFYQHESCGQCTPCRQGTGWLNAIAQKLDEGAAGEEAIDLLVDACNQIDGNTICAHGEAAAWPIRSIAKKFRPQIEAAIRARLA